MNGLIDRKFFADHWPAQLGKPTPGRRQGIEAIVDAWDAVPHLDHLDWLAYALATAWHETGQTMQPVREGFAKTDAEAVAIVTRHCAKAGIENYAQRRANGHSYYGRGYVQLTHAANYLKSGERLGVGSALLDDPDKVMQPNVAARIMLTGMMDGLFRPRFGTLLDYFSSAERDWFNARDLINGDKKKVPPWTLKLFPGGKPIGELCADYGRAFRTALKTR